MLRLLSFATAVFVGLVAPALAVDPDPSDWQAVLGEAKGQTVYFNAWGGSDNINAYIAWVGDEVAARYGITLEHVRLSETADAVNRVLSEKQAGRDEGGAVDLVWINGENFAAMKRAGLLLDEAWSDRLPNYALADTEGKATLLTDFTTPVCGLESPWGTAQLSFYYDSAEIAEPPVSLDALAGWIAENPGRFTYAAPPNFIGTTFLKQLAYGLVEDPSVLSRPVDPETFDAVTAPVWAFLDRIHPDLWRAGRVFAADTTQLKMLLADREIDIAMTFNPGEASSAIHEACCPRPRAASFSITARSATPISWPSRSTPMPRPAPWSSPISCYRPRRRRKRPMNRSGAIRRSLPIKSSPPVTRSFSTRWKTARRRSVPRRSARP